MARPRFACSARKTTPRRCRTDANDRARGAHSAGLGLGGARLATIETDDPFVLGDGCANSAAMAVVPRPASFQPAATKREVLRLALRELHRAAPAPVDVIALPADAPFGAVEIDVGGCTLCLACVSACPTGALTTIRSGRCCGLPRMPACNADCARRPARRRSSGSWPQLDFRAATAAARVLKEEEPFRLHPLRQAVRRQEHDRAGHRQARGQHWMYKWLASASMLSGCARIVGSRSSPKRVRSLWGAARARRRTTDDYPRGRGEKPRCEGSSPTGTRSPRGALPAQRGRYRCAALSLPASP